MELLSTQTQWATGQGFFHTGAVASSERFLHPLLTYVMDCGAIGSQKPVSREIDALSTHPGYDVAARPFDVVFLSHFDWDHISGVRELHAKARPVRYVIPSTSRLERLYLAARTAARSVADTTPRWYWELLTDPRSWLGNLDGRPNVTEVLPDGQENLSDGPGAFLASDQLDPGPGGTGAQFTNARKIPSKAYVAAIAGNSRTSRSGSRSLVWALQAYVTAAAHPHLVKFEHELLETVPAYATRRKDPRVLQWLVTHHWRDLRDAYDASSKVRNLTSLCLYSGPTASSIPETIYYRSAWSEPSNPLPGPAGPGWLGAGDAALDTDAEADAFVAAFVDVLHHVGTFAVPHHGARSSWNDRLISGFTTRSIPAPTGVIGARPGFRGWEHPALEVVRALGDHGGSLRVVTGQPSSRWSTMTLVGM